MEKNFTALRFGASRHRARKQNFLFTMLEDSPWVLLGRRKSRLIARRQTSRTADNPTHGGVTTNSRARTVSSNTSKILFVAPLTHPSPALIPAFFPPLPPSSFPLPHRILFFLPFSPYPTPHPFIAVNPSHRAPHPHFFSHEHPPPTSTPLRLTSQRPTKD